MEISGEPVRILIVEDDFLVRLTLGEVLIDGGFAVVEAESAEAALEALAAEPGIRLLMTDLSLGGRMDGRALVVAARAVLPRLPVIYMTGRPDLVTPGENEWVIGKPYSPAEICRLAGRLTAAD